ncbi:hypothetical protein [Sphingosinicella sp. BN140058]|uniref:hypothetical protein n=1 Tax=Sphingosinicella sp. BN140058 TaxID=1892855 RepID=UPI0010117D24|nr:hypothetical protein [Sphingosinicella sp. BN140058]QAY75612.1 hypothetical protein ETR14_03015 [Sphingosinicella sp. BN140058]
MDTYTPRSYQDLKARSVVLAAGIEALTPKLPPPGEWCPFEVKWAFLPYARRDPEDEEYTVACFEQMRNYLKEIFPGFSASLMGEDSELTFWVWENVRPNVRWVNERIPQMYLLARLCNCHLEGWTYEDDSAWEFGLSKLIDEAGFDKFYLRPGQGS